MRNHTLKTLALAVGISLAAVALSSSVHAGTLRQDSQGQSSAVTGALPGEVQWTYYETLVSVTIDDPPPPVILPTTLFLVGPSGDNILRLINPNGAANGNLAGAKGQTVCAMIYVFDDEQEMGECCGCPLSSAQLATFSVKKNLLSDWSDQSVVDKSRTITVGPITINLNFAVGSIGIVSAAPNATSPTPCAGESGACNGGCDPTNIPGYSVTTATNLLGSITHHILALSFRRPFVRRLITETKLSDDAGGDPNNLAYLQNQCGALIGNGSGGGICNCPTE